MGIKEPVREGAKLFVITSSIAACVGALLAIASYVTVEKQHNKHMLRLKIKEAWRERMKRRTTGE